LNITISLIVTIDIFIIQHYNLYILLIIISPIHIIIVAIHIIIYAIHIIMDTIHIIMNTIHIIQIVIICVVMDVDMCNFAILN